ncbi:MAG TPA: phosphodiester glycosidase family protein [Vicinamibacterales bacterium]|nr:phosphodiester glycosidase family protein [Vicinamibacterales bacterium]
MRIVRRRLVLAAALALAAACANPSQSGLGPAQVIAPGVELFRTSDQSLVDPAGPIAAYLLKLDPARVKLTSVLSNDEVMNAERVADIAARHGAIAAVNGGFFNVKNGEPMGLLKVAGELVSDNTLVKGAVIIRSPADGATTLAFDQLSAKMSVTFKDANGKPITLPIDGVDTTRERGKLMLYTPAYHADTDTAPAGTDWILDGSPLAVVAVRTNEAKAPIPRKGAVLSFGGVDLPEPLEDLVDGTAVTFSTSWKRLNNTPLDVLERADHIVNGAGLLRRNGVALTDWSAENLIPATFTHIRHPRTLIGVDARGFIWLVAVDGRQADYSVGMAFADLQRLCDRIGLRDALNLDGGGSTTMWVNGQVVNRPSDANGPRAVSDAIVVTAR